MLRCSIPIQPSKQTQRLGRMRLIHQSSLRAEQRMSLQHHLMTLAQQHQHQQQHARSASKNAIKHCFTRKHICQLTKCRSTGSNWCTASSAKMVLPAACVLA